MEFTKDERIRIACILLDYRQEPAVHWKEATDEIQAVLAQRTEAPAPHVEQVTPLMDVQWDEKAPAPDPESLLSKPEARLNEMKRPGCALCGALIENPAVNATLCKRHESATEPKPPKEGQTIPGYGPISYGETPKPPERTFTVEQVKEAARPAWRNRSPQWCRDDYWNALLNLLDPPQPKTPEERVTVIFSKTEPIHSIVYLDGIQQFSVCDPTGSHARRYALGLRAELAKERS